MKQLTTLTFKEVFEAGHPSLVVFEGEFCAGCMQQRVYMDGMEEEYPDVAFYYVKASEEIHLNTLLNVHTTPTTFLFNQGKVVDCQIGTATKQRLATMLSSVTTKR